MTAPREERVAWLAAVCSTEDWRKDKLGHPWTIQLDDGPWAVASDGLILAAVRGQYDVPPMPDGLVDFGSVLREPNIAARTLSLAALRAVASPGIDLEAPSCATCHNTGTVECDECDGDGEVGCTCRCGHEHERECERCDESGFIGCPDCSRGIAHSMAVRPVWIGDGLFDLRLLAKVAPYLTGETAEFRQAAPDRAGFLRGDDWRCVVMPRRANYLAAGVADNAPRLPLDEPPPSALSSVPSPLVEEDRR